MSESERDSRALERALCSKSGFVKRLEKRRLASPFEHCLPMYEGKFAVSQSLLDISQVAGSAGSLFALNYCYIFLL